MDLKSLHFVSPVKFKKFHVHLLGRAFGKLTKKPWVFLLIGNRSPVKCLQNHDKSNNLEAEIQLLTENQLICQE